MNTTLDPKNLENFRFGEAISKAQFIRQGQTYTFLQSLQEQNKLTAIKAIRDYYQVPLHESMIFVNKNWENWISCVNSLKEFKEVPITKETELKNRLEKAIEFIQNLPDGTDAIYKDKDGNIENLVYKEHFLFTQGYPLEGPYKYE